MAGRARLGTRCEIRYIEQKCYLYYHASNLAGMPNFGPYSAAIALWHSGQLHRAAALSSAIAGTLDDEGREVDARTTRCCKDLRLLFFICQSDAVFQGQSGGQFS